MPDGTWGGRAQEVVDDLDKLVRDVEPGLLTGDDASRLAVMFDRAERLCAVAKAILSKRAAECAQWSREGFRSREEWYARMIGAGMGAAKDQLALADQVDEQPEVAESWRTGEISATQAKEISRAAQADPSSVQALIGKAKRSSHKGLKDACRQTVAAARSEEDEAARHRRIRQNRYCRLWVDDDGAGRVEAKLTPEALAAVGACLDPFTAAEFDMARVQGRRERHDAYAADALVAMARAAVGRQRRGGGEGDRDGGGSGPGGPSPGLPCPASTVIAVVSHDALVRGCCEPGETCVIDGVGPVPVATVRAMTTDAFLAAVVAEGIDIRSVAHAGRQVTARQRTALTVRDPHCVVPGCHVAVGLEIDHVTGWAVTRTTTIDDLARLCRHHHELKTHHGWTLTGPPGQWSWTPPATPGDLPAPTPTPTPTPKDHGEPTQTGPPGPTTLFDDPPNRTSLPQGRARPR